MSIQMTAPLYWFEATTSQGFYLRAVIVTLRSKTSYVLYTDYETETNLIAQGYIVSDVHFLYCYICSYDVSRKKYELSILFNEEQIMYQ